MAENNIEATENTQQKQPEVMKHTVKDSVFTDLFQDKKYLLQLYKALHPEDTDVTEEELTDVTIKNVLTDNIYNDLGFRVGDRLMVLAEEQATWTMNIIIRGVMYMVHTWNNHIIRTKQNLYKSKKVKIPEPEIYIIFTGERKTKPSEITLSQEFFGGKECCIDVKVKMIYDGKEGDIINQYVAFTKICNEQMKKHGRTRDAIKEAIRICKDRNVLKEYLSNRESEVVDIMMVLYDDEEIMRSYVESERHEARQEAWQEAWQEATLNGKIETAKEMIENHEPLEKIIKYSRLPKETILELQKEKNLQPV